MADSSVILKWLYSEDEDLLPQANLLLQRAIDGKVRLLAPELAKYEVGNVLLKAKKLPVDQGHETLNVFYALPLEFENESFDSAKTAYKMGIGSGMTYYDASFAALAKQEKAILVTANPKHQIKMLGVKVVALENYK